MNRLNKKWMICLVVGSPLFCCSSFFGYMELVRRSLGTIEYHFGPQLHGDVFVLSPLNKAEPPPGHFKYKFDSEIVLLNEPLRRSAGKIEGFVGTKEYPNVCYPKAAKFDEYGVWQGSLVISKAVPGYEIWMFHVGKAGETTHFPTVADYEKLSQKISKVSAQ